MRDDELLELIERVYTNIDMICKVAQSHRDPWDEQVYDFNRELRKLIDAGLDFNEWLIPENLIRPMYGERRLPSGEIIRLKRITDGEFFQRSNPAVAALAREIKRRRLAISGTNAATREVPDDPAEVWVIHGRDDAFRGTIFDLLRRVRLHPIEFNQAVAGSGSGAPVVLDLILSESTTRRLLSRS